MQHVLIYMLHLSVSQPLVVVPLEVGIYFDLRTWKKLEAGHHRASLTWIAIV